MIYIFNYLPAAERTRVETVRKTWNELAKQFWNIYKELEIDHTFLRLKTFGIKYQYKEICDFKIREILKRYVSYLLKINYESYMQKDQKIT